jgi:hypothetical protein
MKYGLLFLAIITTYFSFAVGSQANYSTSVILWTSLVVPLIVLGIYWLLSLLTPIIFSWKTFVLFYLIPYFIPLVFFLLLFLIAWLT